MRLEFTLICLLFVGCGDREVREVKPAPPTQVHRDVIEGVVESVDQIDDNHVKVKIDGEDYELTGSPDKFFIGEYNTIIIGSSGKSAEEVFLGEGVLQDMSRIY